MDLFNRRTNIHVVQVEISPTRMTQPEEKKYKSTKMKQITTVVCALFNSGGGTMDLHFANNRIPKHDIDGCVRMIEQCAVELVGVVTMASHMNLEQHPSKIAMNIQGASRLITISYNLYLPSESQVIAVPPTESPEEVIIKPKTKLLPGTTVLLGSHQKRFVRGQKSSLAEDTRTEFKQLKGTPSKRVTLADRITGKSNKLAFYISAFANHQGGHIYYGISSSGEIEGQIVTKKEESEIVKKVAKSFNKMVWTPEHIQPEKGKQWEIFFEPVLDTKGNQVQDTFVIVLYVAGHSGAVFTEEPESYFFVEGEVRKMSFHEWWTKFRAVLPETEKSMFLPSNMPSITWSSKREKTIFRLLNERLIQHRNDQDMSAFKKLSKLAKKRFASSNVRLIITAEKVVVAYKRHQFHRAESYLRKLRERLQRSKDSSHFEVRMLQLKSMIERSKGDFKCSLSTAQIALAMINGISDEFPVTWFYPEAAMAITTALTTAPESQSVQEMKNTALRYINLAAMFEETLEHQPNISDIQQKLHIYKAMILLGCSITGEVVKFTPSREEIEAAGQELACVYDSVLKGRVLSHFRKVQCHLVECDLFRRRSEVLNDDKNLKHAFECGSKARVLAKTHHFENMVDYASKRLADLTEKILRHALDARGRGAPNSFMGFQY